jgi:uncharacterized protein (TIGR02147 family)
MIQTSLDYREILKREYALRASKNPRYSLTAFARFLGISQSRLSKIFSYKQGLSREFAERIADRLGYSASEKQLFVDLVESAHSRSPMARKLASARLGGHDQFQYKTLQLDAFHAISDWYHFGITELAQVRGFKSDPVWIAKRLQIAEGLVEAAIERLIRLNMLVRGKDGRLRASMVLANTPNDIPSDAIKRFHSQTLEKAAQAIYSQPVTERNFSACTLPFRVKDISEAKKAIQQFMETFEAHFDPAAKKDSVFCLSTQFFRLDQADKSHP